MAYSLLQEQWLPVLLEDGTSRWIPPHGITGMPRPVALNPPRPDFKAALMEWLVGLLQTTFAPHSQRRWEELLEHPPQQEELARAFAAHEQYFQLFGAGPRFMQDLTMSDKDKPIPSDVAALLIEQPGENTIKNNTDFFIKRGQIHCLCPACAAAALYTLQAFAPSGGKGNRTSLRGGGPLSTLLMGKTLWESVWLNVLPCGDGAGEMPEAPQGEGLRGAVYPWAASTRTSASNESTHPNEVHPLHAYWSMPRRILLKEEAEAVACDMCGREQATVSTFLSRPYGYNYGPYWRHPLTPYREMGAVEPPLSIKGQSNSAAYSNWLGLIYGEPSVVNGKGRHAVSPARCMRGEAKERSGRIVAAGYNMSNAKAVSWCEQVFPIYTVQGDADLFAARVYDMVQAADQVRRNLLQALKDALVNEAGKKQAKIDSAFFENAGNVFWSQTEQYFYDTVEQLALLSDSENDAVSQALLYGWGKHVLKMAETYYVYAVWDAGFPVERMEQRVEAQDKLRGYSIKKLRDMAMYPPKEAV